MQNTSAVTQSVTPALGPHDIVTAPVIATPAQAEVLGHLRAKPEPATAATLASELDHHPNTVREHLTALIDLGLVQRTQLTPTGRGRPTYGYRAAPTTRADATTALVAALVAHLADTAPQPAETATTLGRTYAARLPDEVHLGPRASGLRRTEALAAAMRRLGFAAESDRGGRVVRLRNCPLLDIAQTDPDVVCGFHRGLAQGVADVAGIDPDTIRLTPFAEPGACRLDLTPAPRKTP